MKRISALLFLACGIGLSSAPTMAQHIWPPTGSSCPPSTGVTVSSLQIVSAHEIRIGVTNGSSTSDARVGLDMAVQMGTTLLSWREIVNVTASGTTTVTTEVPPGGTSMAFVGAQLCATPDPCAENDEPIEVGHSPGPREQCPPEDPDPGK